LTSDKNKKEKKSTDIDDRAEKLGLSKEARLTEDQKKKIKKLNDNRFLISTSPIEEEQVEEEEKESEVKERTEEKIEDKLEDITEDSDKLAETIAEKIKEQAGSEKEKPVKRTFSNPRDLVKLLSSYKVPLDSTVRTLIKRIKKKGKTHLRREIDKLESGGD
jgi:hypothetical protein